MKHLKGLYFCLSLFAFGSMMDGGTILGILIITINMGIACKLVVDLYPVEDLNDKYDE